jgi:plastocyanin
MTAFPFSIRRVALCLSAVVPVMGFGLMAAAAPPAVAPREVAIKDFAFVPQVIMVKPGAVVTWTNADEDPHTVVANDKSFHSAALDADDKYSFTFTKPGEYAYFCSLHPHMTGKIIVKG